jgi:hypothetical protein
MGCAFAVGTSEVFIQSMPSPPNSAKLSTSSIRLSRPGVVRVRTRYYDT